MGLDFSGLGVGSRVDYHDIWVGRSIVCVAVGGLYGVWIHEAAINLQSFRCPLFTFYQQSPNCVKILALSLCSLLFG